MNLAIAPGGRLYGTARFGGLTPRNGIRAAVPGLSDAKLAASPGGGWNAPGNLYLFKQVREPNEAFVTYATAGNAAGGLIK